MKDKKHQFGYTIVEVMIVLAVSGMMFVIAANFINGKQQRTSFFQGSNDMANIIQKVIDDVTNGNFSDVALDCDSAGAGSVDVRDSSDITADTQGTNPDCVFLGKLVHFYIIVDKMRVVSGNGSNYDTSYSVGFVQSAGAIADPATGRYANGGQTISMVFSNNTTRTSAASDSNFGLNLEYARSVTICLNDGTRYANLPIGGHNSGGQLNVRDKQLGQDSSTCGV